jgi:hypothetical protein
MIYERLWQLVGLIEASAESQYWFNPNHIRLTDILSRSKDKKGIRETAFSNILYWNPMALGRE